MDINTRNTIYTPHPPRIYIIYRNCNPDHLLHNNDLHRHTIYAIRRIQRNEYQFDTSNIHCTTSSTINHNKDYFLEIDVLLCFRFTTTSLRGIRQTRLRESFLQHCCLVSSNFLRQSRRRVWILMAVD